LYFCDTDRSIWHLTSDIGPSDIWHLTRSRGVRIQIEGWRELRLGRENGCMVSSFKSHACPCNSITFSFGKHVGFRPRGYRGVRNGSVMAACRKIRLVILWNYAPSLVNVSHHIRFRPIVFDRGMEWMGQRVKAGIVSFRPFSMSKYHSDMTGRSPRVFFLYTCRHVRKLRSSFRQSMGEN
jgi:hypothetical protein